MIVQKIRSKLRRKAVNFYRDAKHTMQMDNRAYNDARGCRILTYHGICLKQHTRFNTIFLTLKMFERHLQYYKTHFNVVSLNDYYNQQFNPDKLNICLTFDDGFANNYKYVLPLLQQYQIPATFFITAIRHSKYDILWNDFLSIAGKYGPAKVWLNNQDFVKDKLGRYYSPVTKLTLAEMLRSAGFEQKAAMMEQLYPLVHFKQNPQDEDYWLQMTEEQIKALSASPFVTIGSHGYYHNDLSRIPLKDAITELQQSKHYIEGITQKNVDSLAFPYGSYNGSVVSVAKATGYNKLLALEFSQPEDASDDTMRERFTLNPFISVNNQMYAIINNRYV